MTGDQLNQADRLVVAGHIKAIADANDPFEAWRAEEIAKLLSNMPRQGSTFTVHSISEGSETKGHAAGVGDVSISDGKETKTWSVGSKDFRCGAYVIEKHGETHFEIRHVMETVGFSEPGEMLRLRKKHGRWEAALNVIWPLNLGIIEIKLSRYKLWKIRA